MILICFLSTSHARDATPQKRGTLASPHLKPHHLVCIDLLHMFNFYHCFSEARLGNHDCE